MTVRLIPSESDSSPSSPVAAPLATSELPVTTSGSDPVTTDPGISGAVDLDPVAAGTLDPDPVVVEHPVPGPVVPGPAGVAPTLPGSVEVDSAPGAGEPAPADSRVALREARRARRRTAWLCAAVVALALALTIVVVSLARTRPVPQSSAPLATPAAAHILVPSVPTPGAPAPEGGTP